MWRQDWPLLPFARRAGFRNGCNDLWLAGTEHRYHEDVARRRTVPRVGVDRVDQAIARGDEPVIAGVILVGGAKIGMVTQPAAEFTKLKLL